MKALQCDPPIEVSGHAIVVVSVVTASGHQGEGVYAFVGEKRPVAIICRRDDDERILTLDCRDLGAAALRDLFAGGMLDLQMSCQGEPLG